MCKSTGVCCSSHMHMYNICTVSEIWRVGSDEPGSCVAIRPLIIETREEPGRESINLGGH